MHVTDILKYSDIITGIILVTDIFKYTGKYTNEEIRFLLIF